MIPAYSARDMQAQPCISFLYAGAGVQNFVRHETCGSCKASYLSERLQCELMQKLPARN